MEVILRRQSLTPNDDDKYYELPRVGNPHRGVTEHAVQRALFGQSVKTPRGQTSCLLAPYGHSGCGMNSASWR